MNYLDHSIKRARTFGTELAGAFVQSWEDEDFVEAEAYIYHAMHNQDYRSMMPLVIAEAVYEVIRLTGIGSAASTSVVSFVEAYHKRQEYNRLHNMKIAMKRMQREVEISERELETEEAS